jgi:hypothetical protein
MSPDATADFFNTIDPERTFVALLVISKTALHKPM